MQRPTFEFPPYEATFIASQPGGGGKLLYAEDCLIFFLELHGIMTSQNCHVT